MKVKIIKVFIYIFCILGAYSANATNNHVQEKTVPYQQQKVAFKSGENTLQGILFTPSQSNGKTVTLIGPVGYVKEQAPLLYGQSLAEKGYIALIYDPSSHGESEGEPRRTESAEQKTLDIIASVDYLSSLDNVDQSEIYGLAICQGVNWMIKAVNRDDRIKAMSLVAGHYLDPEVAEMYNGSKERLKEVISKAEKAKEKYAITGEVDYIPIVGSIQQDALLASPHVYDWYIPWENNTNGLGGKWENRISQMSLLDIWQGDVAKDLLKVNKPILLIHSDKAASGPSVPKRLFSVIPTSDKAMVWFEDQFQTMFYDDRVLIKRAVGHVDKWFKKK
ncbi:alpha/beta hydrolase [Thalassomonas actiniarum]|uniref:Alpha/beta hydrolase n=1 Tax=Thalassomonas actiniarum TaxID=485447 RepID=A0AAF0C6Q7_9GAMM|nr:alpha/beta hydrolase [Thalassomonas actiniarum]